mgnify:FL=1
MFNFSMINSQMVSPYACDSLNILANQQLWDIKANSVMYATPTFNPSFVQYPDTCSSLPDPIATVQHDLQAMQNGNFNLGGIGGFSMPSIGGGAGSVGNFQLPPLNLPCLTQNDTVSGNNDTKYSKLKNLITKYRDTYKDTMSDETLKEIKEALNKSGTEEEKLDALKAVAAKLDAAKLKKVLLDSQYKNDLIEAGTVSKKDNTQLYKTIGIIDSELKAGKWETLSATFGAKNGESDIVKIVSAWNDTHKSANDRSIIRLCAEHIGNNVAAKKVQRDIINCMGTSLVAKASEISSQVDGDCTNLTAAKDALTKAIADLGTNTDDQNATKFTKANLIKVADAFEKLYATIRLTQAQEIDNKMKTKYEFLNEISDKKVFDNTVTADTKADLAKEGIDISNVKVDKIQTEDGQGNIEEKDEKTKKEEDSVQNPEKPVTQQTQPASDNKSGDATKTETLAEQAQRLSTENAHLMGERFCLDISGYTNDEDFERMQTYIKEINQDNVIDFLNGYYDTYSGFDNGFFEQIASERGKTRLSNGEVVKVMKALIDRYAEATLEDDAKDALEVVKRIYEEYKDKPANERFSNEGGSWWYRLWGCDDLDKLDDAVETLLDSNA